MGSFYSGLTVVVMAYFIGCGPLGEPKTSKGKPDKPPVIVTIDVPGIPPGAGDTNKPKKPPVIATIDVPGIPPGAGDTSKSKKPPVIIDTGKLGAICKSIIDDNPNAPPMKNISELKDRFLNSHNNIRARYGLKALVWDDQIAAYAQRWADYLKNTKGCRMQHRSSAGITEGKKYGENLAWNWISKPIPAGIFNKSPEFGVWGWSEECKDYSYTNASCTPGEQCGHFTQVVWANSTHVGCGMAICDGAENAQPNNYGRGEVWVCNYDPPGNIVMIDQQGKKTPLKPF